MAGQRSSSIRPVRDIEMAETSSTGGPQVAQDPRNGIYRDRLMLLVRFLYGLSALLVLSVFVEPVYCLVLRNKLETIVPEFKLESAAISLLEMTSDLAAVGWEVTLVAINPNTELGINYQDLQAAVVFNGYGNNNLVSVATERLPDFFLNNGTQKGISFKLGMVRHRNDAMVSKTIWELGRAPRSVMLFGLNITVSYSYNTKKLCYRDSHRWHKQFLWKQVKFQNRGTS